MKKLTPDESSKIYHQGFAAGELHSKPSDETEERLTKIDARLRVLFAATFTAFMIAVACLMIITAFITINVVWN